MAAQERTEAATPRRREEARRKGQVARSTEINSALLLLVAAWTLQWLGPRMADQVQSLMRHSLARAPSVEVTDLLLQTKVLALGGMMAQSLLPVLGVLLLIGLAAGVAQVGLMVTLEPLRPQLSRINPFEGARRLISGRSLVELAKTLAKLSIIGLIAYQSIRERWLGLAALAEMETRAAAGELTVLALEVVVKVAWAMVAVAVLDYAYQRWSHGRSLRMSRQEVREELKETEGNPLFKSRMRQRQRALARQRMMRAVPQATVVITNPVHLAVALRYEAETMSAPQVVAKGQRLIAEQIKRIASAHAIPIVENKPLAQTLHKSVDIGQEIPPDLYAAVAEVLAFVYRLTHGRPTAPAPAVVAVASASDQLLYEALRLGLAR